MLLPVICLFIAGTLLACSGDSKSEKKRKAVEANQFESYQRAVVRKEEALKEEAARKEAAARKEEEAALKEEEAARIKAKLNDPALKIYSRLEFRNRVLGKNKSEVLANVGTPTSTSESSGNDESSYRYTERTKDPVVTGRIDFSANVYFNNNVAYRVSFN